jgi:DnaJ-class molecular chaperone
MTYDHWKTTEDFDQGDPPEQIETCPDCCGEGSIEVWESVSKWSIDPPCAYPVPCQTCNGAGFFICEMEPDA